MHILNLPDDMTIYTAAAQKLQLMAFIDSGDSLKINLSKVEELDSAGLQLLIMVQREAAHQHKQLQFTNPSKVVKDILNLTNLGELLGIAAPEQAK